LGEFGKNSTEQMYWVKHFMEVKALDTRMMSIRHMTFCKDKRYKIHFLPRDFLTDVVPNQRQNL